MQAERSADKIQGLNAFYCSQLSALSQRVVLECIFRDIVKAIPQDVDLQKALNATTISASAKKLMLAGNIIVSMTQVNNALLNLPFRAAAWRAIGFPPDTPFPSLPGEVLYGDLSSSIHAPNLRNVFLSDRHDKESDLYLLLQVAAKHMQKKMELYSEEAAAAEAEAKAEAEAAASDSEA